jgi:hypothetical protein
VSLVKNSHGGHGAGTIDCSLRSRLFCIIQLERILHRQGADQRFLYPFEKKYMISVAVSMIGVPVIPIVFGISPQLVSLEAKGASSVRDVIKAPVKPSRILTIF